MATAALPWAALAAPFLFQTLFGGQTQTRYNAPHVTVPKKKKTKKKLPPIKKDYSRAKIAYPAEQFTDFTETFRKHGKKGPYVQLL